MKQQSAQLTLASSRILDDAANVLNVRRFEITNTLQTTLDIEQMLLLFIDKIKNIVLFDGYLYEHAPLNVAIDAGIQAHHSCHYNLTIGNQELGSLTLFRRQRFSDDEITAIETMLCCLVYPLKNAITYQEALRSARIDPLTNVNNRVAFREAMDREYQLSRRTGAPLSALLLDVDHFKTINDKYGHACGDSVLTIVAEKIVENVRSSDLVFRYGGEEFVVLLSNTPDCGADLVAQRILGSMAAIQTNLLPTDHTVTVSIGVAELKPDESVDEFLQRADQAMYRAKHNGRNQICAGS